MIFMKNKDALLIDELPAGSKLYYRSDGAVVILGETNTGFRQLYTIRPQRNLKDRSCLVQKWSNDQYQMVNSEIEGGTRSIPEEDNAIIILQAAFPSLNDPILDQLDGMEDDIAWELAAFLEDHPRIHAAGYPINYLALLLWQENGKEILNDIENTDGKITTAHLCEALGVTHLTYSMKQFIRLFKPLLCKQTHIKLVRSVLQQWHIYKPVFCRSKNGVLDTWEVYEICECLDLYPTLAKAKWFHLGHNGIENAKWLSFPEEIQTTYNFYGDTLAEKGKPIPSDANSLDRFLTRYIRSSKQFGKLFRQAQEQLTERGENWLEENYPDDYQFENLPPIVTDGSRFRMLRTAGQLREMAKKLRNCAAGYLHEAATGKAIFFAYEYSPENNLHPLPQHPDHPVDGLLALRRDRLDEWQQTGTAPDWSVIQQKLVVEFKGFRNAELGQHAWDDLESFMNFHVHTDSSVNCRTG